MRELPADAAFQIADVDALLERMGKRACDIDMHTDERYIGAAELARMRKRSIAKLLSRHASDLCYHQRLRQRVPRRRRRLEELKSLQAHAKTLCTLLQSAEWDLALEADSICDCSRGLVTCDCAHRAEGVTGALADAYPGYPKVYVRFLSHAGEPAPSKGAKAFLQELAAWVAFSQKLAGKAERRIRNSRGRSHEVDAFRYLWVIRLSWHYARWFNETPTSSVGGPWLTFLREVLSRIEGKRLSEGGIRDLWTAVRDWMMPMGRPALGDFRPGRRLGDPERGLDLTRWNQFWEGLDLTGKRERQIAVYREMCGWEARKPGAWCGIYTRPKRRARVQRGRRAHERRD